MRDRSHLDDNSLLATLRRVTPEDHDLVDPPPDLWDGIAAELFGESSAAPIVRSKVRRRRPWAIGLVGLAAATAAAVAVGLVMIRPSDPQQVVSVAALSSDGLENAPAGLVGRAAVVDQDGNETLTLSAQLRPSSGEYLEVWLLKADASGLVSLGAVRPDGDYQIPAGLSIADYPIVDVSSEPYDGNPGHSGVSLVRGRLEPRA